MIAGAINFDGYDLIVLIVLYVHEIAAPITTPAKIHIQQCTGELMVKKECPAIPCCRLQLALLHKNLVGALTMSIKDIEGGKINRCLSAHHRRFFHFRSDSSFALFRVERFISAFPSCLEVAERRLSSSM